MVALILAERDAAFFTSELFNSTWLRQQKTNDRSYPLFLHTDNDNIMRASTQEKECLCRRMHY